MFECSHVIDEVTLCLFRQQVNQFLSAVAANPELKAVVEQQTQLKVPEPRECGAKHNCCVGIVGRLFKTVLFCAFVLGSSFFIAVSSLVSDPLLADKHKLEFKKDINNYRKLRLT